MDNQTTSIQQKVTLNTLTNNRITCDEYCATFYDEADLYDEHLWFNHRPKSFLLKYSGCHTKPIPIHSTGGM